MAPSLATADIERHLAGAPDPLAQVVTSAPKRLAAGTLTEEDIKALEAHVALWRDRGAALRGHLAAIEDLLAIDEAIALTEADLARIAIDRPAMLGRLREIGVPRGPVSTEALARLRGLSERLVVIADAGYQERMAFAAFLQEQRARLAGRLPPSRVDPLNDMDGFVSEMMERYPVIMAYLAR